MAIKFNPDTESVQTCETCGQECIRREITIAQVSGARKVVYDSHAQSGHEREHHAALERIEAFHEEMDKIRLALKQVPKEERVLELGRIVDFEIETVKPSACERRTHIVAVATLQFDRLREYVRLAAQPLAQAKAEKIFADLKLAAAPVALELQVIRDRGQ